MHKSLWQEENTIAKESKRKGKIKTDVLIILVGLSGGTGSGALLATVQMALRAGAFVLILPILPFAFEGSFRNTSIPSYIPFAPE